jgi:hypothetical protein
MTSLNRLMLVAVLSALGLLSGVQADKTFSYLSRRDIRRHSDADAYGIEDWDEVERSRYYFDWGRFYDGKIRKNECKWDSPNRQSPIDIKNWDDCDMEEDDKVNVH